MTKPLHWIHEDALNADHPAFQDLHEGERLCFVWDDEHLRDMGYSFQRLVFIYETLCELNAEILRGSTAEVLHSRAQASDASEIRVPDTPNPAIQAVVESLRANLSVSVIPEDPFVDLDRAPSLRRFFAYWKSARRQLMRP